MTTLTYSYLGDALQVGEPLGCDSSSWPYQVVSITHIGTKQTKVELEPWPIPGPAASELERLEYSAALAHARKRKEGRI